MKPDGYAFKMQRSLDLSLKSYGQQIDPDGQQRTLDRRVELAMLGLFVLGFWLVASRVPASGDDWAWGTELGTARLRTAFVDYNGRYVGNIIVLIMTRLGWVTPILEALGFAFIIGLILDITHSRTMLGYVTLISLVFLMPARLWSESAVWVSGYANYAVATLVMLLFLRFALRELVQCANDQQNPALLGVIFGLSVAAQLIVEHVTIYLLVASLAALLVARSNQQGVNRRLASSALGLTVGAVIMFSNSSYRLAATGDSYKKVASQDGSFISSSAAALRNQIATNGLVSNTVVIFTITTLIAITAVIRLSRDERSASAKLLLVVPVVVGTAGALIAATRMTSQPLESGPNKTVLAMVVFLGFMLWSSSPLAEPGDRMMIVISVISLLVLFAPLLLVSPIGARNFLPTCVLLLVLVRTLLSNLRAVCDARLLVAWKVLAISAGVVAWLNLFTIYSEINRVADERLASVRSQIEDGKLDVTMERLPNGMWIQYPDPLAEPWVTRFKRYYDLPPEVSISLTG